MMRSMMNVNIITWSSMMMIKNASIMKTVIDLIDEYGEKIKKMEVYVSVIVDVSDCKKTEEAYRLSKIISGKMMNAIEKEDLTIYDNYEVFRNDSESIVDADDEE